MNNVPRRAPLIVLVAMVGALLSVPILGLTLGGLIAARLFGAGPEVPVIAFVVGNVLGWAGVRWLYHRERRRFARP